MDHPVTPTLPIAPEGIHLSAAVARALGHQPELMNLPNRTGYTQTYIIRGERCPYGCGHACDHEHWTKSAGLFVVKPWATDLTTAWELIERVSHQSRDRQRQFARVLAAMARLGPNLGLDYPFTEWPMMLLHHRHDHQFAALICRAFLRAQELNGSPSH